MDSQRRTGGEWERAGSCVGSLVGYGADAVDLTLQAAHNELMGWQSVVLAGVATTPAVGTAVAEKAAVASPVGTASA